MRAISLRFFLMIDGFSTGDTACCTLSFASWAFSASMRSCRSLIERSLISALFILRSLNGGFDVVTPYNKLGGNRQLLGAETERFLRYGQGHTLCLEENTSGRYGSHKSFGITLTFTHTDLGGLLRDGFVGEDADPQLALTLHVTRNGLTGRLDLTTRDPGRFKCLDCERSVCKLVTSLSKPLHTAFLHSSKFGLFRL